MFLLALIPGLLICYIVFRIDKYDREAPFLVVWYRTLVERTWCAAREVRVATVVVWYVVPAVTSDTCVYRIDHCLHRTIAVQIKEQQVFDIDV